MQEESAQIAAGNSIAETFEPLVTLLLVAVLVAIVAKRYRFPYTVALVLVGLVVGVLWQGEPIHLSRDLILLVFLPPLLFEGCINMDLEVLRRNALPIALLAVVGTGISILLLGRVIGMTLAMAGVLPFLVGTILSPTDPVSVLATFKELGVRKGLSVIVEGESVFNDGLGVVIFLVLLDALTGEGGEGGLGVFIVEVGVGAIVGVGLGVLAYQLLKEVEDELIEVVLSLLLAYGSYIVAVELHGSGVIAVVAAGLIMGNYGRLFTMAPGARITLSSFWEVTAFLANSLIFLLIGIDIDPGKLFQGEALRRIVVVFVALMAIRGLATYACLWVSRLLQGLPPTRWMFVVFWGGLRSTIPIALVLGLPAVPHREEIKTLVFGVVLLSLLVQGLSLRAVLRWLGLAGARKDELALGLAEARELAGRAAQTELEVMRRQGEVSEALHEEIRAGIARSLEEARRGREELMDAHPSLRDARRRHVEVRLLEAQRVALARAVRRGIIREEAFERLRHEIDETMEKEE